MPPTLPNINPKLRERAGCELIADLLRAGCDVRLRVTGTSMFPNVWPGDVLAVRPSVPSSAGEIVLFIRDGHLIAHRVVELRDAQGASKLVVLGDSFRDCDAPLQSSELLGVITDIFRNDRRCPPDGGGGSLSRKFLSLLVCRSRVLRPLVLNVNALQRRLFAMRIGLKRSHKGCESHP
jgi:hypothetical protein